MERAPDEPRPGGRGPRRVAARLVAAGAIATVAVIVAPIAFFGPPSWVPDALVPSFLDRSSGPTVALVPGGGWIDGAPGVATESAGPDELPRVVLLTRPIGEDRFAEVAYASLTSDPMIVVDESAEPAEGVAPIGVGELAGLTGNDPASGHRWVTVAGEGVHLTVWSGLDTTEDELVALADSIDLARPLAEQKLSGDWHVAATPVDELGEARIRVFSQQIDDPGGHLEVTTRTGVGPDAMWLVGSTTVADRVEVRGRAGLITGLDSSSAVTLTWTEVPGVVVQLTYSADHGDLLSEALSWANDLRPVDQETWESFAAGADTWEQVEVVAPEDEPPPPTVILEGILADGRAFRLEERRENQLCVVIDGPQPLDRCELGRRDSDDAVPLLVDPGDIAAEERSPLLVVGYLPQRQLAGDMGRVQEALGPAIATGQAVAVHVADERGRDLGAGTITGDTWALHIPQVAMGLVVTYRFPDGTSLEVDLGATAEAEPE